MKAVIHFKDNCYIIAVMSGCTIKDVVVVDEIEFSEDIANQLINQKTTEEFEYAEL